MKRIYDWGARPALRKLTVADLIAAKGNETFCQVTADTADEAAAAEAAGCEMVICRARNVAEVRRGSAHVFVTAALGFADNISDDEILRAAIGALTTGADAVITSRGPAVVEMLAREDIPVMGHLGLVPRKSTWVGSMRAFGKTADEAFELYTRFKRLEDAGGFAVEAELIPDPVMAELTKRSGLVTVSLGSGRHADVLFLFMADICGEMDNRPRHARAYGDLAGLYRQVREERVRALSAFRQDIASGAFPAEGEVATLDPNELESFRERLTKADT